MLSHLDTPQRAPTSLFLNPPLHPNWHPLRSVRPTTAIHGRAFALVAPGNRAGNATVLVARRSAPFMSRFSSGYATHSARERREARGCVAPTLHTVTLPRLNQERERESERKKGENEREKDTKRERTRITYRRRGRTTSTPPFPYATSITFVSITLQIRRCSKIIILVETWVDKTLTQR